MDWLPCYSTEHLRFACDLPVPQWILRNCYRRFNYDYSSVLHRQFPDNVSVAPTNKFTYQCVPHDDLNLYRLILNCRHIAASKILEGIVVPNLPASAMVTAMGRSINTRLK